VRIKRLLISSAFFDKYHPGSLSFWNVAMTYPPEQVKSGEQLQLRKYSIVNYPPASWEAS